MNNYCVVTTVNKPTKAIEKLYELFGNNLIIVGDKKTPTDWEYKGITPVQHFKRPYAPDNHYARKNLGYLKAISAGAKFIQDQDDDTIPYDNWEPPTLQTKAYELWDDGWVNVYKLFIDDLIWPRGLPLNKIHDEVSFGVERTKSSPIQQGMVDGEPDVDAIWRLVLNKKINFTSRRSVAIMAKSWCPFNSQNTGWFPKAFPLMYLPITATFRMTDIFRSFIGQRCLWEIGEGVTFHSPSGVYQDRNEHDLMKDFEDEVPGYLQNEKIAEILSGLKLKQGVENICENLLNCYRSLWSNGIFEAVEMDSVIEWVEDYQKAIINANS